MPNSWIEKSKKYNLIYNWSDGETFKEKSTYGLMPNLWLYQESMMATWNMEDRAFHAFGFHCF